MPPPWNEEKVWHSYGAISSGLLRDGGFLAYRGHSIMLGSTPQLKLVLLVEDDPERASQIQSCMPEGLRCVWAKSAGAACGILKRDAFAAIMLDFDLYRSLLGDPQFTGETVAATVCETQARNCQILVHSQNPSGGRKVVQILTGAGFSVVHLPWSMESKGKMQTWLQEVITWE